MNADIQTLLTQKAGLVTASVQVSVTKILESYYETVKKHLVFEHQRLKKMELSNDDFAIARGEIAEDRKETYERRKKFYEKLRAAALAMSISLKLSLPDLKEDDETKMTIGIAEGQSGLDEKVSCGSSRILEFGKMKNQKLFMRI